MLAQRMEMNLRETLLRQPHVVLRRCQVSQRVRRITRHALRVGVDEFLQFFRAYQR